MHDGAPLRPSTSSAASALFSASQPTTPSATASPHKGRPPFKGVISLSDFEDDSADDKELDGCRVLGPSERRVGTPVHRFNTAAAYTSVADDGLEVRLVAHRKTGEAGAVASKEGKREEDDSKWVRLDEDEDESAVSSAVYTEIDEDDDCCDVALSLADRLQGKANAAGLGVSLSSIR